MNRLDKTPNLPNLNNKLAELVEKLPSVYEERLADLCSKNPDKEDLNNVCSSLNLVLDQELWKIGFDFKKLIWKVEKPIWEIS